MCRDGGEGELNMGGGGIPPISDTPREPRLSWLRSPLWISWPLGVTLSLGSMESGLTASLTVKMRGWSSVFWSELVMQHHQQNGTKYNNILARMAGQVRNKQVGEQL